MRNLLLSGGIYHPFAETSACVAEHLRPLGIDSEITSVEAGLRRLQHETFDLITINALAFSMQQADKYAPLRAQYAYEIDAAAQNALKEHVQAGRGLLGLHTAAICFDTWPEWYELLGATWVWGESNHPMPDYLTVNHGTESYQLWDELYCGLALHPQTQVLATAHLTTGGAEQPILMAKDKVAYLTLGHDLTSLMSAGYADMLRLAARHALATQQEFA